MRSTSRKMRNRGADLAIASAVALLAAASGCAHAQGLTIPGANNAPPPVISQSPAAAEMPAASAPMGLPAAPVVQQAAPQAMAPPPQAARVAAPVGLPVLGAQANATPSDMPPARAVDRTLDAGIAQAAQKLNAAMPDGLASADARATGELDDMATRQRKIRDLKLLNMQADELAKLNKTLGEGPLANAGQPGGIRQPNMVSEQEVQKRIDQARQEAAQQAKAEAEAARKQEEDNAPRPVVASIFGSAKEGRKAIVLIPYIGEVTAKVGTRLQDGMRVVAISERGVEVSYKGERSYLGFGDSVPRVRPMGLGRAVAAAQPGVTTYSQPVLGSPLPISGAARIPGR